jgi:hypothetical protein
MEYGVQEFTVYNFKCYASYSILWWDCSKQTVNSSACSFFQLLS